MLVGYAPPVRIALDIDSTLHHYWGQLELVARRRFGVELPYATQSTWRIDLLTPAQLAECAPATLRHPWNAELCALEGIARADDWPALGDAPAHLLGEWRADGGDDDAGNS
jgi:hypothetical protein